MRAWIAIAICSLFIPSCRSEAGMTSTYQRYSTELKKGGAVVGHVIFTKIPGMPDVDTVHMSGSADVFDTNVQTLSALVFSDFLWWCTSDHVANQGEQHSNHAGDLGDFNVVNGRVTFDRDYSGLYRCFDKLGGACIELYNVPANQLPSSGGPSAIYMSGELK